MSATSEITSVDQFENKHSRNVSEEFDDDVVQADCFSLTCLVGSDSG